MATAYANIATLERKPIARFRAVATASTTSYRPQVADYVDKFNKLVAKWRTETDHLSSIREKMADACFESIIAMGEKVIPLIIAEIQNKPDFLFLALHQITNHNPAQGTSPGKTDEMIAAWLMWAEQNAVARG